MSDRKSFYRSRNRSLCSIRDHHARLLSMDSRFALRYNPAMRHHSIAFALLLAVAASLAHAQQMPDLQQSVDKQLPALVDVYKDFHRNPELSHHEERTSAKLAADLRKLGYTVTEHIGKYMDGSPAWGIVAVLENGKGPRFAYSQRHGRVAA